MPNSNSETQRAHAARGRRAIRGAVLFAGLLGSLAALAATGVPAYAANNNSLDFYYNIDGNPTWNPSLAAGPGTGYSAPAMVRSSNSTEVTAQGSYAATVSACMVRPLSQQLWAGLLWADRPETRRLSSIKSQQPRSTPTGARYALLYKIDVGLSAGAFRGRRVSKPVSTRQQEGPFQDRKRP